LIGNPAKNSIIERLLEMDPRYSEDDVPIGVCFLVIGYSSGKREENYEGNESI